MQFSGVFRSVTTVAIALSLCASPAIASASAPPAVQTISPMVALSIFGSQASAAALCGSSATNAAASAAATVQAPAGGCVLPVVDTPPPISVSEPAPYAPAASFGFGLTPILLGLAGIAILAALIISQDNDNDNDPPVSIN